MRTNREVEAKFELPEGASVPDLTSVVAGARMVERPTLHQRARYFDTGGLTLLGFGVTLRYREEDDGTRTRAEWTLKVPAVGPSSKRRSELSWSGAPDHVPGEAARLVGALTRYRTLGPVATVTTVRHRCDLMDDAGVRLAEVADDEVTVDHTGPSVHFRQLEVELADADEELLDMVARALRAHGARRSADRPKLAEALDVTPGPGGPAALRRSATVGDTVRFTLARIVAELDRQDLAVRLGNDPEVVHKARVATRRGRADLGTLARLLDPGWVADTRAELRWLGQLLGEARDADVLSSRIARRSEQGRVADRAGFAALAERLAAQREVAYGRLRAGLAEDRYLELLQRLDAAVVDPPWGVDRLGEWRRHPKRRAAPTLRRLVRRQWRRLRRRVRDLPASPSAHELHRVRIQAKRLRYAAELARPVVGAPAGRVAGEATRLQDALGAHQDAVAAEDWLRAVLFDGRRPPGPAEAFVAGQLVAIERREQAASRAAWPAVWRRLRRMAERRWPA